MVLVVVQHSQTRGATNTLTLTAPNGMVQVLPITNSSILFDLTNAVSGSQAIVYHRSHIEPIYNTGTIKIGEVHTLRT